MKTGVELIADERLRQVAEEGYADFHDDTHDRGELAAAAESYLIAAEFIVTRNKPVGCSPSFWPWSEESWKPSTDPVRNLVKAGALIAAEIDRLQRKK